MKIRRLPWLLAFWMLFPARVLPRENPEAAFEKALQAGDLSGAQTALSQWALKYPKDAELMAAQGLWWHAAANQCRDNASFLKDADCAAGFMEKAVKDQPTRLDYWLEACELYLDLGEDHALMETLGELTRGTPSGGWTWRGGSAPPVDPRILIPERLEEMDWDLLQEGDRRSIGLAGRLTDLAAKRYPDHPGAFRVRGRLELEREKYKSARADLEAAVQRDGSDSETWMDLGQALWQLGLDGDARRAYERVLELNRDPDAVRRARNALQDMDSQD